MALLPTISRRRYRVVLDGIRSISGSPRSAANRCIARAMTSAATDEVPRFVICLSAALSVRPPRMTPWRLRGQHRQQTAARRGGGAWDARWVRFWLVCGLSLARVDQAAAFQRPSNIRSFPC